MIEPAPAPPRAGEWWTRPRIVLPVIAALVVLVALLTPQAGGRTGDARLSTHLGGPQGARLIYETVKRLGWRTIQRDREPVPAAGHGASVHAVLAPSMPITPEEAHAYLEAVRSGDGLLVVLDDETELADSLGVAHSPQGGHLALIAADTARCARRTELVPPYWVDGRVSLWFLRWPRGAPSGRVVFGTARAIIPGAADVDEEVAAGFTLGKGRVVVVSDPDLLRNDVVRRCSWGADVRVVRMLEWLRAGGAAPRVALEFDEYHHGFGRSPSMLRTSAAFLADHPVGRTLLQLVLAALVLLLAVSPRAIPPADVLAVERRDPLEQIDALAHAYEQVHATRTLAARLLRGVRSRVERGTTSRGRSDELFLDDAESRVPLLVPEVALVRRALREPVSNGDLPQLGAALRRIEQQLTTTGHA